MDATVTQTLRITESRPNSSLERAKAALNVVYQGVAASARGEAYDRILGSADAETVLGSLPPRERERFLNRGFGKSR